MILLYEISIYKWVFVMDYIREYVDLEHYKIYFQRLFYFLSTEVTNVSSIKIYI